jgi:ketosteroid isomerase-like protein
MHPVSWWNSLFASIDSKNTPAFLGYLTDDAEFRFGNGPSALGHEAVGAAVSGFFETIGGSRHELHRTWEDAESAVCEGNVTYTRLDGSTLTVPFVDVFYFRGDRIARYLIYMDVNPLFQRA